MNSRRRISHLPQSVDSLPRSRLHVNGLPTRPPAPPRPQHPTFIFTGTVVARKALRQQAHRFAASGLDRRRHPGVLAAMSSTPPECHSNPGLPHPPPQQTTRHPQPQINSLTHHCALSPASPLTDKVASTDLSKELPQNGDVPMSPLPAIGSLDAVGRHENLLKTRPWCVSRVPLALACLHIAPTARF
jgi:hypothetical protein